MGWRMAIDAELIISPDLDQAGLVKVMARIDRAMKISAKKAGKEFENEIAGGIRRGIAKGSIGGAIFPPGAGGRPGTGGAGGGLHGPMMQRPESPGAFRARLRREAQEAARIPRSEIFGPVLPGSERARIRAEQREAARIPRSEIFGPVLPAAERSRIRLEQREEEREAKRRAFEATAIHGPVLPASERSRIKRQQLDLEREAERIENLWTIGGVGRRLKGSIKGANIFRAGGFGLAALTAAAPFAITGGAGLWGMMRSFGIRDDVQKVIDDLIKNSTAQNKLNLSRSTGINLGSIAALERQGLAAGMKEGDLAGLANTIMQGVASGDPLFAQFANMKAGAAIPAVFASLANLGESERTMRLFQLGVDPANAGEFFRRIRARGTGKGGEVTLDDVLAQQKEDAQEAERIRNEARTMETARTEAARITKENTAQIVQALGEGGTLGIYLDNIRAQQREIMDNIANFGTASEVANSLEAMIRQLDAITLRIAEDMLPAVQDIVDTAKTIIGASEEGVERLAPSPQRQIENLTDQNPLTETPGSTLELATILAAMLDGWVQRNFNSTNNQNGMN